MKKILALMFLCMFMLECNEIKIIDSKKSGNSKESSNAKHTKNTSQLQKIDSKNMPQSKNISQNEISKNATNAQGIKESNMKNAQDLNSKDLKNSKLSLHFDPRIIVMPGIGVNIFSTNESSLNAVNDKTIALLSSQNRQASNVTMPNINIGAGFRGDFYLSSKIQNASLKTQDFDEFEPVLNKTLAQKFSYDEILKNLKFGFKTLVNANISLSDDTPGTNVIRSLQVSASAHIGLYNVFLEFGGGLENQNNSTSVIPNTESPMLANINGAFLSYGIFYDFNNNESIILSMQKKILDSNNLNNFKIILSYEYRF